MNDSEETLPAETSGGGALDQPTTDPLTTISVQQLTGRVSKVRQARSRVMDEDIHYGTIPGTGDKPTLLKPGAEILCSLFQLAPDPELEINNLEGDHREYIVRGGLRHMPSGNRVGSGYGSCSTKESKYRYRYIEDATDVPVPRAFWDSGDEMSDRDFSILEDALASEGVPVPDGAEAGVTKEQGQWLITIEGKGENPDLADVYNTCLKMAKKRWLVDVTLTATAASEIFTQDLDELEDLRGTDVGTSQGGGASTSQKSRQRSVSRYGQTLTPGQAEKLDKRDGALQEREGNDLAAAIAAVEAEIQDWPSEPLCDACEKMLDQHRKRLKEEPSDTGKEMGEPQNGGEEKASATDGGNEDLGDYDSFPTGFPGAVYLKDAGIETPAQLDQYLDGGEPLTELEGIGETRAEKIRQSLEDLRTGEFEDELPF